MAQRADPHLIAAAIDQLVAEDAGIAAVQACLLLDGNLRERYAKVGSCLMGPVPLVIIAAQSSPLTLDQFLTCMPNMPWLTIECQSISGNLLLCPHTRPG